MILVHRAVKSKKTKFICFSDEESVEMSEYVEHSHNDKLRFSYPPSH
jgi:hypothetical protein